MNSKKISDLRKDANQLERNRDDRSIDRHECNNDSTSKSESDEENSSVSALLSKYPFGSGLKLTLSGPMRRAEGTSGRPETHKIMITDKGAYDQVERFVGTKVFHENIARAELPRKLAELLREFRHLTGSDDFWTYDFRISKKGKLLGGRKRRGDFSNPETSAYPSASFVSVKQSDLVSGSAHRQDASRHNRVKNYILEQGDTVIPALRDLGVITAEGKVVAQMYDKYRQINRYVEVVDHEVRKFAVQYPIGGDRCFRVIDFGSGKSYLTFILYHYLTEIKKMQVEMIGLDLKEDVVTH